MTTRPLTERDAQLKEAARDLLQLAFALHPEIKDVKHPTDRFFSSISLHAVATRALEVLDCGALGVNGTYSSLVAEVAAEEGSK